MADLPSTLASLTLLAEEVKADNLVTHREVTLASAVLALVEVARAAENIRVLSLPARQTNQLTRSWVKPLDELTGALSRLSDLGEVDVGFRP
ncbi:MAG TPA: hypothetical protein VEA35_00640 [Ramlibacter sp.]|nr:hypothetical protein [Ramlibacter sp.]